MSWQKKKSRRNQNREDNEESTLEIKCSTFFVYGMTVLLIVVMGILQWLLREPAIWGTDGLKILRKGLCTPSAQLAAANKDQLSLYGLQEITERESTCKDTRLIFSQAFFQYCVKPHHTSTRWFIGIITGLGSFCSFCFLIGNTTKYSFLKSLFAKVVIAIFILFGLVGSIALATRNIIYYLDDFDGLIKSSRPKICEGEKFLLLNLLLCTVGLITSIFHAIALGVKLTKESYNEI